MVALTDGERWARAELERLLERRFSPAAVAGFLATSFRRSADVRRSRPELARQSRRWMAVGAAAWLLPPFRARARTGLAWWALTSLMLDWHLGMVETPDGRPRPLSGADALTLVRAWLVPVAARDPTPAVVGAAVLSDVLDGALARRGSRPAPGATSRASSTPASAPPPWVARCGAARLPPPGRASSSPGSAPASAMRSSPTSGGWTLPTRW